MKASLEGLRDRRERRHRRARRLSLFPERRCADRLAGEGGQDRVGPPCPHGVQFFDVVIDGKRHERAAWRYEAPLPSMHHVADRFGFWDEVEVG